VLHTTKNDLMVILIHTDWKTFRRCVPISHAKFLNLHIMLVNGDVFIGQKYLDYGIGPVDVQCSLKILGIGHRPEAYVHILYVLAHCKPCFWGQAFWPFLVVTALDNEVALVSFGFGCGCPFPNIARHTIQSISIGLCAINTTELRRHFRYGCSFG